jgi:hypothetical protein
MKEKAWVLMGHSTLENPVTRKVPKGVTLVLMTKCGRQFNQNNKFHQIFKKNNLINKYLTTTKTKNVFTNGNNYTNQFVQLETNNGLPHGLYNLPTNIRSANYRFSYARGRPRISNVLTIVKDRGGGVVFGMFCRGTPGVKKLRSGVKTVGNLSIRKGQKGPFGSPYNKILENRKSIKSKTIRSKTHTYTRKVNNSALNYGNF